MAVALDLINTWDELHDDPDKIEGLVDVRTWLGWHGLDEAAKRVTEADVERVRELRSRLDRVFDAANEAEAASRLNELARELGTPPQLERISGRWRLRTWPEERKGLPAVAAYATAGLQEAFRELGWRRFGRCAGAPCRCAFVDRSRNRTRRYCCSLCADRVAQAQYRTRKRERPASQARRRDAGGKRS
jgi:predicted RNA-binding Zn ribbon-like protein